ncbi:MAG: hypothetical protein QXJ12_01050, partial [Candidatus Parvarchaeota archaeon]|nr:hypothetical protein [Candidatus Parvarchaeota archaeon]
MFNNKKGYRVERKIRLILSKYGWSVVRSGGSLGEYDLVAFKRRRCVFFQVKSTSKDTFYYYGYSKPSIFGFPFLLIVDFGYGNIRVLKPKKKIKPT